MSTRTGRATEDEGMDAAGLVGQLFVVDFDGPEPHEEIERLIRDGGVGGVILFDKNIVDPPQIARLTNGLQRLAERARVPPLLVTVDQEGGPVVRVRGTHFPSAMAFGAAADEALVAAAAEVTARELRAVGIHMNHAPVLDVNNNPANPVIGVRSFGEDPRRVARFGVRAVTAMQAAGVLASAKHFPGHGDTSLDSHLTLPAVPHPRRRLDDVELLPFREAIQAGVAGVLTAHVVYPALDPDLPATLSPRIIELLLRRTLGFDGLVVTDSMRMRAVADRYTPGDAAVAAVQAGVDVVLACGPVDTQWAALEGVRAAVRDGRIAEERIRQAARRVLAAKRRLGLFEQPTVDEAAAARVVGCAEHLAVARRVAEAAATIVRAGAGIPLPPGPVQVATDLGAAASAERLAAALRAAGRPAETVTLGAPQTAGRPAGAQTAIVLPFAADPDGGPMTGRVREATLAALRRGPAVAVSLDVPYPLSGAAEGCAALAVYSSDPHSIAAAAGVLSGRIHARGSLPVTIP